MLFNKSAGIALLPERRKAALLQGVGCVGVGVGCARRPRLQGDRSHNSSKILSRGQHTDLVTGVFSRMEYYNSLKISRTPLDNS
ncbi:hypothetical protein CEXT_627431 [Caerostris extrusa]|uniref:Uncharacterized protein n=1 Tax=Caerostris extrusa TaxID=172846 RepID=A0AAV4XEZ6_CAEEX|nr:hypothetical protein CEXT_627431 [Caerostris extrusa]